MQSAAAKDRSLEKQSAAYDQWTKAYDQWTKAYNQWTKPKLPSNWKDLTSGQQIEYLEKQKKKEG